jgi:hypothetical protein
MKESTFLNKIKQIRDKAAAPLATVLAAPANAMSAFKKNRDTANFTALKQANAIPKKAPNYNPDGSVTDYFKTRSTAEGVKQKMSKSSISIPTTSKMNRGGEIINPTSKDVSEYNKKFETIRFKK